MAISGNWILHYSWGCTQSYAQANITFNSNGTFSGTGTTGKWIQQDGTLLWAYDTGPAKYGGTVDGSVGSGAMSTFAGSNGCWYLTQQGTVGIREAADEAMPEEARQSHDVAGNEL